MNWARLLVAASAAQLVWPAFSYREQDVSANKLSDGNNGGSWTLSTDGSTRSLFAEMVKAEAPGGGEPLRLRPCRSCKGFIDYAFWVRASSFPILAVVCLVLWAAVLVWLLNTTAQEFFVPPLMYWSRKLRLKPEVAGATLVALGNGAPDVFAMATAAGHQDLPLALSELLGANMCVLGVSGGAIALTCYFVQRQNLEQAAIAVASANAQDPDVGHGQESGVAGSSHAGPPLLPTDSQTVSIGSRHAESIAAFLLTLTYLGLIMGDGTVTTAEASFMPVLYVSYLVVLVWGSYYRSPPEQSEEESEVEHGESDKQHPGLTGLGRPSNATPCAMVAWVVAWPTYAIRWVLIPPADLLWDRSRRVFSSLAPLGLLALFSWTSPGTLQELTLQTELGILAMCCILSVLMFVASDDGPCVPWFYPGITLISKISSILVLKALAEELTSSIETFGLVYGIPRLWLGSTVIAWGNSLGDLVTGIAMARHGQARMAFTSVFAAPLFNCLVGAGIALFISAQNEKNVAGTTLWTATSLGKLCFFTSIFFLYIATLLLAVTLSRPAAELKFWASALFALYAVYVVSVLSIERIDMQNHGGLDVR